MKFRVSVLPQAVRDIEETYLFIVSVQLEPLAAQRWVDGIQAAIHSLTSMARRGRRIREQEFLGTDYELRQILLHKHRIIYAVRGNVVQVVHVRRGSRADAHDGDALP